MLIEVSDPPVAINDDHAVDRTFENGGDAIRRIFGLLLRPQQLALAVLQSFGHGVERVPDMRDFRLSFVDVHPARIVTEAPSVRGVDQFFERTMNKSTGTGP